jgi:hypothetical protein
MLATPRWRTDVARRQGVAGRRLGIHGEGKPAMVQAQVSYGHPEKTVAYLIWSMIFGSLAIGITLWSLS